MTSYTHGRHIAIPEKFVFRLINRLIAMFGLPDSQSVRCEAGISVMIGSRKFRRSWLQWVLPSETPQQERVS